MTLTDQQVEAGYAKLSKRFDEISTRIELYDDLYRVAEEAARKASHFDGAVLEEVQALSKEVELCAAKIAEKAAEELRKAWNDSDQYGKDLRAFEASFE